MKNSFKFIVLAIIVMVFTWNVVSWSEQHGKLAFPPDYDDSHSLVEGAVRLGVFQEGGFGALFKDYKDRMPHSFLHYYWTGLLFLLFGIHQAVPYAANGLLLFGVLWVFARLLPNEMLLIQKVCYIFAFLGIPVCFHLIHDYRSEVTMAGLLFIASAQVVLWSWRENRKWFGLALPGVFFSLAFLMKPMMFPYPLGMMGLATFIAIISNLIGRKQLNWRLFGLGIFLLWCVSLAPISVHLWIFWDRIIGYISEVAFTSDYYKIKEKAAIWYFHWLGYSGVWHLSSMRTFIVVTIFAAAMTWVFPVTRKYSPGPQWFSMAFLTIGAFGGIAINQVNQPFFGMTFQLLAAATALLAMAHFLSNSKIFWIGPFIVIIFSIYWWPVVWTRQFLLLAVGVIIMLLIYCLSIKISFTRAMGLLSSGILAIFFWKVTQVSPFHNYINTTKELSGMEGVNWRLNGPSKLFEILLPLKDENSYPVVWFSNYSWVDANSVGWEAAQNGMPWKMYNSVDLDLGALPVTEVADILVVSEPGVLGELQTPHLEIVNSVVENLKKDMRYRISGKLQDPFGKKIIVYSKVLQAQN